MSTIDLGDNPVGSTPTEVQKTQLRSSIGLGSADTVEFGAIVPPAGTTAEINAVANAAVGQVMVDSERGYTVRFKSSSEYDVIGASNSVQEDSLTTSSGISLADSKLQESGLVPSSSDVFVATATLVIFNPDTLGADGSTSYLYHSGEQGPAGWYDSNNVNGGIVTSNVVVPNKTHLIKDGNEAFSFQFNSVASSDTSSKQLFTASLLGGSEYKIEISMFIGDLEKGNLNMNFGYNGLYNDATVNIKCDDLKTKNQVLFLKGKINPNESLSFITSSQAGVESPLLGSYDITLIIKPSSSGDFSLSVNQLISSSNPLLIGKADTIITKLF